MHICTHQWPWFAILVRTGEEKSAALLLENGGYESFLPLSSCAGRYADGIEPTPLPLFPGYLFCRMNPQNRVPVLRTPGVIQIVGVSRTPIPVDEGEISAIQRAGKSGLATMPWPYLRAGIAARMEDGPLQGLTGIIVRIKFGMKLVLSVSLLQRSMAVEIDRSWIGTARHGQSAAQHALVRLPAPSHLEKKDLESTAGRQ
jgi:transcriptional antiterminator RfaH